MRRWHVLGLAAALAVFVVPQDSSAQVADRMRRERIERERIERERRERDARDDRYDRRYDRDDRYERGRSGKASGGPAFCRSGRGHPVHGRRWCADKGFGLGGRGWDRRYDDDRWDRVRWGTVILRDDRRDARRDDRYGDSRHDGGWLRDVVGDIVFGRLTSHSRSLGWNEPLAGEWFDDDRARVLTVFSGSRPFAELIDADRDGRAEDVRVIRGR